jgi:transposase InsO family protein
MKQSKEFSINMLCSICNVSRSGYYEWLVRVEPRRAGQNRALSVEICAIYQESRKTYGAIRVQKELKTRGKTCSKNRVARIMKQADIKSVHRRKFRVCTTDSKHKLPVAENILQQDFSATRTNQKWGCDITYIQTDEGWLYLAIVIDFFSRKIIGWATSDSLHATLCCHALNMALKRRKPPRELIHHSDRGVQYASAEYALLLKNSGFIQSMSRKGNCYDNAMVESCFHTLKVECVYQSRYATRSQASFELVDYIENFYNSTRLHSSLDYKSPVQYETICRIAA